jgi:predicted kinase
MSGAVILVSGPPSAGKPTIARGLAAGFEKAVHLHTDDFWHNIFGPWSSLRSVDSSATSSTRVGTTRGSRFAR